MSKYMCTVTTGLSGGGARATIGDYLNEKHGGFTVVRGSGSDGETEERVDIWTILYDSDECVMGDHVLSTCLFIRDINKQASVMVWDGKTGEVRFV